MSDPLRCVLHGSVPAEGRCARCGQPHCPACLPPTPEPTLCPRCRRQRRRRRLQVVAVVALMVSAPAVVIAWGLHRRLSQAPDPPRSRSGEPARPLPRTPAADPDLVRQAERLVRSGRPAQARALLGRLLKDRPDHPGALHLLARLAREAGDREAVLQHTTRLLARHAGATKARLWQVEALIARGQPDAAERSLRQGLAAAPRSGGLALALAELLVTLRRPKEALEVLRNVLVQRPDAQEARIRARLRALEQEAP